MMWAVSIAIGFNRWEDGNFRFLLATRPTRNEIFYLCVSMQSFEKIKEQLKTLKVELSEKFFVNKIGLFGSVTRDDFSITSDIDIVVGFSKPVGIEFIDLANYLESQFKRKVDLVSLKGIKQNYFDVIKDKIVYV